MELLDLTLSSPELNLALDEALLMAAEEGEQQEVLRLWESPSLFVAVGRASIVAQEVNLQLCRERQIPVLRRCSGGTAVTAGPGCLMYALVLSCRQRPQVRRVDQAHAYVMQRMQAALSSLEEGVEHRGSCDLALHNRKVSGNSLRCKRDHVLYHGTVLYDFPLGEVEALLGTPPYEPDYRDGRSHGAFVGNFPRPATAIRRALCAAWDAHQPCTSWPRESTESLVAKQYAQSTWNLRR